MKCGGRSRQSNRCACGELEREREDERDLDSVEIGTGESGEERVGGVESL